ncbi:MAG: AAA family ATPase [Cyanobacteria bacterium J06656_5]
MAQRMKILGLKLSNYRQFKDFYLDLIDTNDKPLNNVCLIGVNGTGKSTILYLISQFLEYGQPVWPDKKDSDSPLSCIAIRFALDNQRFWILKSHVTGKEVLILPDNISAGKQWSRFWEAKTAAAIKQAHKSFIFYARSLDREGLFEQVQLKKNSSDLAIYAAPDGQSLLPGELPKTSLDNALGLLDTMEAFQLSSYSQLQEFWNVLIYQIKKRERDYQIFLADPEVQKLTVADAREQFDTTHPEILTELAVQWNLILEKAGLVFDIENAKIPIQAKENLQVYIKSAKNGIQIPYNSLSTGIRNFIFRLGHIYSLYFNRTVERGFLLIDEPEASLFPDLLYDIIERYKSIITNTQFFVATHSPIIAAQFKPEERIILEFNDDHYVTCRRGISPEGDDPNDLLVNDFIVRSLYGKEGLKQWDRYLELRRIIPNIEDPQEKRERLAEYARIGNTYNFAEHEISGET